MQADITLYDRCFGKSSNFPNDDDNTAKFSTLFDNEIDFTLFSSEDKCL